MQPKLEKLTNETDEAMWSMVQNIWYFSPLVPSKREKNVFVLLSIFFQFLNDKIQNYVFFDIVVNFFIQKLKSKHTSIKKYTN